MFAENKDNKDTDYSKLLEKIMQVGSFQAWKNCDIKHTSVLENSNGEEVAKLVNVYDKEDVVGNSS